MMKLLLLAFALSITSALSANSPISHGPFPADLNGSNFTYPWPLKLYRFRSQGKDVEMAFMDVAPARVTSDMRQTNHHKAGDHPEIKRQINHHRVGNEPEKKRQINHHSAGDDSEVKRQIDYHRVADEASHQRNPHNPKIALLLHGKNFCGATWASTASSLSSAAYRVIIPDQLGFCKSTKPGSTYQFSLHQLALNTHNLLSALNISTPVTVIGHSLGGMLAARYALMYPNSVSKLVMVNPIGLEDWKALGVPYQSIDLTFEQERNSTYTSIRAYEQSTYYLGDWTPAYDVWVRMLADIYHGSQAVAFAESQARVVDMVYTQPVVYEFSQLKPKTLMVVGEKDTTVIGKQWSPPEVQKRLGNYQVLGKRAVDVIPTAEYLGYEEEGHAPQISAPERIHGDLMRWLEG